MVNSERWLCVEKGNERAAVFGYRVDCQQQFAHGGDERDLMWFATFDQAPIEGHQPGVAASCGTERRHPQCLPDPPIADRGKRRALRLMLTRVPVSRAQPDVSGQ